MRLWCSYLFKDWSAFRSLLNNNWDKQVLQGLGHSSLCQKTFPVMFCLLNTYTSLQTSMMKWYNLHQNHPTQFRRLTWVRSWQNGVFHFVKTNRLYENWFIPPRWDHTSTQVRFHLVGMIFFLCKQFFWAVPPRQDCSFSLNSLCFYNCYMKTWNSSYKV